MRTETGLAVPVFAREFRRHDPVFKIKFFNHYIIVFFRGKLF
jgi:hypothetical protein